MSYLSQLRNSIEFVEFFEISFYSTEEFFKLSKRMIKSKKNMKRFESHIRSKSIFQQSQQFQFKSAFSSKLMIKTSFVNNRLYFVNENFIISQKNFFNKDKRAVIAKKISIFLTKKTRHRIEDSLKTILK